MDEGPHTRPDVERDQINQFVKANSKGVSENEGSHHSAHADGGEAGAGAKESESMVVTDGGMHEGGGKEEGNGAHPAGAVRALEGAPDGASDITSHLNGGMDRPVGIVAEESKESKSQGVAVAPCSESDQPASEARAGEGVVEPTPKDELSQSAQPGEPQPAPSVADMSVDQSGTVAKVEGWGSAEGSSPAGGEEALPPPADPPTFLAPCLRGKLYQAADGRHVCKGLWAMKRTDHDLEGDDLAAVTNKFEFSCMPPDSTTAVPMDGQYQGFFWITLKKLSKFDDTCNLSFARNSAGGWNISGSGTNKCGSYQISGTVSAEMNLELFRLFDHLVKGKTAAVKPRRSSTGSVKKAPPPPRPPQQPRLASLHLNSDAVSVASVGADSTVSHLTESTSFARHDIGSTSVLGIAVGVSKAGRMIKAKLPPGYGEEKLKPDKLTAKCLDIISRLMKHPAAYLFNQPVDPVRDQCPDYFQVIANPIDFGTIKTQLENLEYPSPEVFAEDVRLVFQNAVRYNPRPEHFVHIAALQLSQMFEDRFTTVFPPAQLDSDDEALLTAAGYQNGRPVATAPAFRKSVPSAGMAGTKRPRAPDLSELSGDFMDEDLPFDDDMGELNYDELADTPVELPPQPKVVKKPRPASYGGSGARRSGGGAGRKSTPAGNDAATKALLQRIEALEQQVKAKDSGEQRRILTYDDKKKLSKSIETLPPEKAAKVIKIIQSRMDLSMAQNEEVEIDIDTLPNDTLLELQAYVNKCNQPKRAGGPVKGPEGKKRKSFSSSWGGDSEDDWTDDES